LYGENAVQIDGSDYDDACWTYIAAGRNPYFVVEITNNRRALREKYGLPEEPCDDCSVVSFCSLCAVCQAARELKFRSNMPSKYILLMKIISHFCTFGYEPFE
jgi:Cys-rich protein (TIGR01571 family)